ncbi:DUF1622 domain-containing protein [soil metagenome]
MPYLHNVIELIGGYVDVVGVAVIVISIILSTICYLRSFRIIDSYRRYRQNLGKGILLGLEILVAGDIIRTVGVAPTMESVLVLALIVLVRTFLSWSLEVELEGRWPWQAVVVKQS